MKMRIIVKPMRAGKTYEAIKHCAKHGGYMVCINDNEAARVAKLAKQMGLKIPYPLTFREAMNKSYYAAGVRKLHIDNADMFIQHFFSDVKIESITINGNWSPPKAIKEEVAKQNTTREVQNQFLKGEWADIEN